MKIVRMSWTLGIVQSRSRSQCNFKIFVHLPQYYYYYYLLLLLNIYIAHFTVTCSNAHYRKYTKINYNKMLHTCKYTIIDMSYIIKTIEDKQLSHKS